MNKFKYIHKTYRNNLSFGDLVSFEIKVKETDLLISALRGLAEPARESVFKYRGHIEHYIKQHSNFLTSFVPLSFDKFAPEIVQEMLLASEKSSVGPMAAVAGAIAQFVAQDLLKLSNEVVVENGGDIYAKLNRELKVGIFAASSPLSNKLIIRIKPEQMPIGICTSSATVGHSVSLGGADAVCVLAKSAALADAAATAAGNAVKVKMDILKGIKVGAAIDGVLGLVIVIGDQMGAWGEVEFV